MGKIAVIGAGSWGTALAQTLAAAGNEVVMWARKPEVADAITKEHHNPRYLSGIMLSDEIVKRDPFALDAPVCPRSLPHRRKGHPHRYLLERRRGGYGASACSDI